jgi:hypothetical protein
VRLVPDRPLDHWRRLGPPAVQPTAQPVPLRQLGGLAGHRAPEPVAEVAGLPLGYASLLARAWASPPTGSDRWPRRSSARSADPACPGRRTTS